MSILLSLHNKIEKAASVLNNVIVVLIGTYIFFNPFPHTTAIKEITFYLSVFFVLLLAGSGRNSFSFKTPLTCSYVLFFLWAAFGVLFALNKPNTINDLYAHLIKYYILFYLVVHYYGTRNLFLILLWIFIGSTALFSAGGLLLFYIGMGNELSARISFIEMSSNYLPFATVTALLLSLQLVQEVRSNFHKGLAALCALSLLAATILTQTRSAYLALTLSSIFLFRKKWVFLVAVILAVTLSAYAIPGAKNRMLSKEMFFTDRITTPLITWEIIKDHPISGIGFGMETYPDRSLLNHYSAKLPDHIRKYRSEHPASSPHNFFMDVAVRTGLVGFVLFLGILFVFVKMYYEIWKYSSDGSLNNWGLCVLAGMISFLLQGFFADAAFGPQAIVFYLLLAMMTILWEMAQVKRRSPSPAGDGLLDACGSHQ
jgi:O-antigen ligase